MIKFSWLGAGDLATRLQINNNSTIPSALRKQKIKKKRKSNNWNNLLIKCFSVRFEQKKKECFLLNSDFVYFVFLFRFVLHRWIVRKLYSLFFFFTFLMKACYCYTSKNIKKKEKLPICFRIVCNIF